VFKLSHRRHATKITLIICTVLLMSCQKVSHDDIHAFIEFNKEKPAGKIKPLKRYPPYKPYVYSAQQLRSPFVIPYVVETKILSVTSNVQPDFDRQKQRLENFELSSLSMVGTVKQGTTLWALIRDPEGSIERVKIGYYLGGNNGRIVDVSSDTIDVVEIVSNGDEAWLERPNIISMREQ
jgi:type IV pilus assembly protein PilP